MWVTGEGGQGEGSQRGAGEQEMQTHPARLQNCFVVKDNTRT